MSSVWSRSVVFTLVSGILFLSGTIHAQINNLNITPKRNSPYSRFGLGDLQDQYLVPSAGMGGLSAGFYDPLSINTRNPATLALLKATAFEIGLSAKYSLLDGEEQNTQAWSGNLDYLVLGFPLTNPINEAIDRRVKPLAWGMSLMLQPYSVIGYDILATLGDVGAGETTNSFKGTGGTYRVGWGNAVQWKNLALGVQLHYLFGKMTNSRRVEFSELSAAYSSEILDETSVSGLIWEAGLQYILDFRPVKPNGERDISGKRLILGAFGNNNNNFSTNTSRFVFRDNPLLSPSVDTIEYVEELKQRGTLPAQLTFGFVFEDVNRLKVGMEYGFGLWENYRNEARPDIMSNTWNVAAGLEYTPDFASYNNFFDRMRYRVGAFYRTDPRTFAEGQLRQYALTLGLGLPIIRPREQTTFINFALELGQFGLADLIQETYVKMALGFTLNDNTWFFKPKFN